jgi:hypothetical protein
MMRVKTEWKPNSFLDKFNRAATVLGYSNLPLAWGVANVDWKSPNDMDDFLQSITTSRPGIE